MEMIEEAYCSFEVAKLLKDKGFDESCYQKYDDEGYLSFNHVGYINNENPTNDFYALAPTHQLACAWIRSKGYNIEIQATASGFVWSIDKLNGTNVKWSNYIGPNDGGAWDDYDECMESALKYYLTNLI